MCGCSDGERVCESERLLSSFPLLSRLSQLSIMGDCSAGHVGIPIPSAAIKLVDVPEMEYEAHTNGGEVCVKGPTVFKVRG